MTNTQPRLEADEEHLILEWLDRNTGQKTSCRAKGIKIADGTLTIRNSVTEIELDVASTEALKLTYCEID